MAIGEEHKVKFLGIFFHAERAADKWLTCTYLKPQEGEKNGHSPNVYQQNYRA